MGGTVSKQTEEPGTEGAMQIDDISITSLWKVENYSKIPLEKLTKGPSFQFCRVSYYLSLHKNSDLIIKLHREGLAKLKNQLWKFQCKICVLDPQGQEHHTKIKDVAVEEGGEIILMKILATDLQRRKGDIIPTDTLTIRLKTVFLNWTGKVEPSTEDSAMFLEMLSNDLGRFYQGETDTDCILKTDTTQFPAHRAVLSARSTVLASMFHPRSKKNYIEEVNIKDVEAPILKDLIYYIYTGKIFELSADNAASMYKAADKYALSELKEKCLKSFISQLAVDNICKAAIIAESHNEPTLKNAVIQYVKDKSEDVLNSDEWENFFNGNHRLAGSILKATVLDINS